MAFLDNMLQAQIFHTDTRSLLVPTGIQKLTIDVKRHAACLEEMGSDTEEQGEIRASYPGRLLFARY